MKRTYENAEGGYEYSLQVLIVAIFWEVWMWQRFSCRYSFAYRVMEAV